MTISAPTDLDPGSWGIEWDDIIDAPAVTDPTMQDTLLAAAIVSVWYMTGQRFGIYTETALRPLPHRCDRNWPGAFSGYYYDALDLDPSETSPVVAVTEVVVDGTALDAGTDYGVVNNRWLIRTPSGTVWPVVQDIAAEPDASLFSVSWRHGLAPTADLLDNAVCALVRQLWKAWNHQACSLNPQTVQSVQREGISFALVSPGDVWKIGRTGDAGIDAACVRAWPFGPAVADTPTFFDPATYHPGFAKFERT